MVKATHRVSVKDGGVVQLLGGSETSRRATAPRRQPSHGVGKRWRQSSSLTRQSPSAVAWFIANKGKHVRREAGLPHARRRNKPGSDVITLDELRQITNNFSDDQLIGEGAFGKVYKGVLTNGDTIAVKRFAFRGFQNVQYENEAQHLMRLKHSNIVQLVGYCSKTEMELVLHNGKLVHAEKFERLLCLEYMPKGSLRDHLSDETCGLEWNTRYKIIEGICYGLRYLHEEWQATPIIHMDLKPANILLDDNMVPKIADFGLSRLFGLEQTRTRTTNCKGTPGYMAPEYIDKGVITKKFDIFSLGVIIIEIITGLRDYPTDETETTSQQYIDLVLNKWRHRPKRAQRYTSQENYIQQIKKCIQIALSCVKVDPVKRPTINAIIKMLERSDEADHNGREWWFDSWKSTVLQDLFPEVQPDGHSRASFQKMNLEELRSRLSSWERMNSRDSQNGELRDSKGVSMVRFMGPHQGGWKETSTKGMRAVADPSPQPSGQQLSYVALKKTLELDNDGNGNKWCAHEYTPLLPSEDGSDMLTAAEISLRLEFKEDEPPSAVAASTKRKEDEPPSAAALLKERPIIALTPSALWEYMTKVQVKVAANNADGSQSKKPCYEVQYVICHHCGRVFNFDRYHRHRTLSLRRHLNNCQWKEIMKLLIDMRRPKMK